MEDEKQYYIDRYYELLHAFRDMPEMPSGVVLKALGSVGTFPDDYNEGKRIQSAE